MADASDDDVKLLQIRVELQYPMEVFQGGGSNNAMGNMMSLMSSMPIGNMGHQTLANMGNISMGMPMYTSTSTHPNSVIPL
jgi:hypothetical protein